MRIEAAIFDFGRTIFDPETRYLFPKTRETLKSLQERQLKLGLLTVAETDNTEARRGELTILGISHLFHSIDVAGRSTEGKDFTKILIELDLQDHPEKCLIVGDNLKREIAAGNKIGAYTVWTKQKLSGDFQPQNPLQIPNETIYRIEDIVPIVDRLNSSQL